MAVEHRLLTEVAPLISAVNPAVRCSLVVAYDPKQPLLMLEMIDGRDLKSVLFGRGPAPGPRELLALLGLCGGWLARFHALSSRRGAGRAAPPGWTWTDSGTRSSRPTAPTRARPGPARTR